MASTRGSASICAGEVLVAVHSVDVAEVGLDDFGRPDGFLARQVSLWRRQWEQVKTRELPDLERLLDRLADDVPTSTGAAVIHGDYRIDNAILDRSDPSTVRSIIDWELSTVGDPLTDLAL
jgi:aminoglycoside phosphotransferase (APT) family kinase protein